MVVMMKGILIFLCWIVLVQSQNQKCYVCRNCPTVLPIYERDCDQSAVCCMTITTKSNNDGDITTSRKCSDECFGTVSQNDTHSTTTSSCEEDFCNGRREESRDTKMGLRCYKCDDCGNGKPSQDQLVDCPDSSICCEATKNTTEKTLIKRNCADKCFDSVKRKPGEVVIISTCSTKRCNSYIPQESNGPQAFNLNAAKMLQMFVLIVLFMS